MFVTIPPGIQPMSRDLMKASVIWWRAAAADYGPTSCRGFRPGGNLGTGLRSSCSRPVGCARQGDDEVNSCVERSSTRLQSCKQLPARPGCLPARPRVARRMCFYESTGLHGQSTLRRVRPQSGRVTKSVRLAEDLFGEGLATCRQPAHPDSPGSRIAGSCMTAIPLRWFESSPTTPKAGGSPTMALT